MLNIVAENPLVFIASAIIGLATAWWIWGSASSAEVEAEDTNLQGADSDFDPETDEVDSFARTPDRDRHPPEYRPSEDHAEAAASIAAAAAAPATVPEAQPKIAPAVGAPDDLKRIKGVGPKLEKLLNSLGVKRFDQVAAWKAADIAEVDQHLGTFRGRIVRDKWRAQAKKLARKKG